MTGDVLDALPFALPPLEALLLVSRAEALAALRTAGWRPFSSASAIDSERQRFFNIDLTEPDLAFHADDGALLAVTHVEVDRQGLVALIEFTAATTVAPETLAARLVPGAGAPKVSGRDAAREWVWGPESGGAGAIGGEPIRLWVCSERAYGDRLWAVASLVRRD